jgi:kinetochore protein Spc25, fungi type
MTVVRPPQIDLATILAQQTPQIDLRINLYDNSTRNFLKSVTNFKHSAISVISDRRNGQVGEIKRVTEKIASVQSETNACKVKEIDLLKGAFLVASMDREQTNGE